MHVIAIIVSGAIFAAIGIAIYAFGYDVAAYEFGASTADSVFVPGLAAACALFFIVHAVLFVSVARQMRAPPFAPPLPHVLPPMPVAGPATAPVAVNDDVIAQIGKAKAMMDAGVISPGEFEAVKATILRG